MIFEGEFLEGKRNGKGIEYTEDDITEVEYYNGQKVHKITNYCAWMENEEGFMDWYQYYRYGESPPHIDWMKVIIEICSR